MKRKDWLRRALTLLWVLSASLIAQNAAGQEPDEAEQSADPGVLVVLEPRVESSSEVGQRVAEATGRKVEGQKWFLEEVEARGFQPRQILTRPEDLRWVMDGANIELVVYLPRDGDTLLLKIVGADGVETTSRVILEDASKTLSDEDIKEVVSIVTDMVGPAERAAESPTVEELGANSEESAEPVIESITPSATLKKKMDAREDPGVEDARWLHFFAAATLTERAFVLTDRTLRSASLRTPLYPGWRIGVVAYPFQTSKRPARQAGFLVEFGHGFDTITLVSESQETPVNVTNVEVEAAFLYRFQGFENMAYGQAPAISLRAGAHWASYTTDESLATPLDTAQIGVDLGVRVEQALWAEWLGLEWDLLAHPYVADVTDRISGSQDWGLGFSTDASLNVRVFAGAHLRLGWAARVTRTWFTGIAANNFEDLDSIIFEHSPTAGINYWW